MEPVNPRRPQLFQKCQEEGGVPVRLINEADLQVLPAAQEMWLESEDAGIGGKKAFGGAQQHVGTRGRITTHRFIWHSAAGEDRPQPLWIALRLDAVSRVVLASAFMRTQHCQVHLVTGQTVDIRFNDAASASEVTKHLQSACAEGKWRQGSYEVAAMVGLQRVLGQREARQQVVGETLDVALTDLKTLKQYAAQTVAAARKVAAKQQAGEAGGVQGLLEDFGLLGSDGRLVVGGGTTSKDVEADVLRVCEAALKKRGGLGMLLAHDVFCLVNRARGTALVAPEEVMRALHECKIKGKLRLRSLSGAWAASLPGTNDAEADAKLLKLVGGGPLSAFRLGKELGLTTSEAQYLLRDAEGRAILVRDDAPEGVFYYRNFFDDF